jgi:hypothetical protein
MGGEVGVHMGSNDSGLNPDTGTTVENLDALPAVADIHKDAVGHGLSAEAGSGGTEGEVEGSLPGILKDLEYIGLVLRAHDNAGCEPVNAGVSGMANTVHEASEHLFVPD